MPLFNGLLKLLLAHCDQTIKNSNSLYLVSDIEVYIQILANIEKYTSIELVVRSQTLISLSHIELNFY